MQEGWWELGGELGLDLEVSSARNKDGFDVWDAPRGRQQRETPARAPQYLQLPSQRNSLGGWQGKAGFRLSHTYIHTIKVRGLSELALFLFIYLFS